MTKISASVSVVLLLAGLWLGALSSRAEVDHLEELRSGGVARTYRVHVPPAYDGSRPLPLLLAFHGGGGQGRSMPRLTGLSDRADRRGFLVVYPDGLGRAWNDGREGRTTDDVRFVADLLDVLSASYKIDPKRVYATGISNGGLFSQRLACELSDRIAAIGSVAATMPEDLAPACRPSRAVPVVFFMGTDDPLVPYGGGEIRLFLRSRGRVLSAADAVKLWIGRDGCPEAVHDSTWIDEAPGDGTRVHRESYGPCRDGSEVVLYSIEGGGHTWPGGVQYLPEMFVGKTSRDIDASSLLLDFFTAHPMP
jgi:polyhydroxybutyrate depolymerase